MDFLDKNNIYVCDKCNLDGSCHFCRGMKKYIISDSSVIFWNKIYNSKNTYINSMKRIIKISVNIFFIIFAIFGLISLIYHVYILNFSGSDFFYLENWFSLYMLAFWMSVLVDMFLFYELRINNNNIEKVINIKEISASENIDVRKLDKKDIYNTLSKDVKILLTKSYDISKKYKSESINALHIFYTILINKDINLIFGRLGVNKEVMRQKVERLIKINKSQFGNINDLDLLMFNSYVIASHAKNKYIKVSHILSALILINQNILDIFLDEGIDSNQVTNVITWIRLRDELVNVYNRYRSKSIFKPRNSMNRAMTAVATPYLDRFSQDLTQLARRGYLEISVARESIVDEIYRSMEVDKKSIVLSGLPGVGKDNIVEGIANRMCAEEVPKFFQDKRLVSLSLSSIISASSNGSIEQNFIRAITEVIRAGNIILFINDIHNLVGISSSGRENIDLSEVLSDMMNKYDIMIIGTTNPYDFTKYLEKNILATQMLKVEIKEPDFNEIVQILESKTFSIEYKYSVYFSYQAIEKIVKLTESYMHDSFQPSKSIKILEEVAIYVKNTKGKNRLVTAEDVAKLISEKIHMPLTSITQTESQKLMHLEDLMHEKIIGQDEAVNMVSSALRRARTELRDENKPITNLLFLGPTGVGKTELAKTVANIFFGTEDSMIRLDMSEYQNKDSVSRLIGVEGSEMGGVLTESVRKNPFSLVLLDEIEKAHPDILNIFLQVLDDGRLTDTLGNTIDFSNCIIIATSNAGSFYIQDELSKGVELELIKQALLEKELRPYFKPEFLNRFNGIILFKPLSIKEIEQITVLLLQEVAKKLAVKNINFEATQEAVKELAQKGFSPQFGARPLKRTVEQNVDDALAKFLLAGKIGRRDKVIFEKGGDIRIEKAKKF